MWKHFVKDYLIYTKKERKGIIYIVFIVSLIILSPFLFSFFTKKTQYSHKQFAEEISKLSLEAPDSISEKKYSKNADYNFDDYSTNGKQNYDAIKAEVFYFDPNTASADDWKKLGIRDKVIHTIQKYLSKGGKFYKPDDIGKIWGMPPADAKRLSPYVSIKNILKENTTYEKKEYPNNSPSYTSKSIQPIDVNLADTSAFIALPGIGGKLAQRIISFRNKLGGFYSIDQVGETYLLPDSTFQKIKSRLVLGNTLVKQININTASVDEMKSHPYLRYNLANSIFQYRLQHGNFNSIEEIKKIMSVTEEVFKKVAPYLSLK